MRCLGTTHALDVLDIEMVVVGQLGSLLFI